VVSSGPAAAEAVAQCAAELGDARRFYSTYETVLDLENLREQLGAGKLIPLGISYGGQVAGEYARRYPDRVQALVLDSSSPVEGVDALAALPSLALGRVLREVCFPPGCERLLGRPQELLAAAVARLSRGPLRGRVVTGSGRRVRSSVSLSDLYTLVRSADGDPALRTALPSALDAAARGDAAPLLRLAVGGGATAESGINEIRFLATACLEGRLPWEPGSDPATRPALLEQALTATRDRYAPFPVQVVAPQTAASLCVGWPATERPPYPPSPQAGPDVPVLVLGGREDLRTPLEDQRRTAAQFPRARVVGVPNVGHSVLGNDVTTCASGTLSAFLNRLRRPACPASPRPIPIAMPAYGGLARLPRAAGRAPALVEKTAVAVDLTLRDVVRQVAALGNGTTAGTGDVEDRSVRLGGLRGGRLELRRGTLRLRSYEVVGGVRVSGRLDDDLAGTLVVTGRGATGTLRLSESGTLRGVLGGSRITYRPKAIGG
jgi:pimeloyl-ACP methyl ester carboxylesterase